MSKPSAWVDTTAFPLNVEPHMVSEDVDAISGNTPDEKKDMHKAFAATRKLFTKIHGTRYNVALLTFQTWLVVNILHLFGIDTSKIGPIIKKLLSYL